MRSSLLCLAVVVGGMTQTGCGPQVQSTQIINGTVLSEDGQAIAGAKVTVNGNPNQSAVTNATGAFELRAKGADQYSVVVKAAGYAFGSVPLFSVRALPLRFTLRPIDIQQDVQIPAEGGTPPVVEIPREGGKSALSIPANSLVDQQGNIVSGTVTVSMTYWSGLNNTWQGNDTNTWPGALLAKPDANHPDPIPLRSLGMVDIEVHQGDQLLQVAPGKSLLLQTTVPPILASLMDDPGFASKTFLFYLDPNAALWETVSSLGTDTASWDPNSKVFTAKLPHLSSWNWDNLSDDTSCIQGAVTDCSGNPYQGKARLWLMTYEGVLFYDVPVVNGKWCKDQILLPESGNRPYATTYTIPVHVSGVTSPAEASLNPTVISQACATCAVQSINNHATANYCECSRRAPAFGYCSSAGAGCYWGSAIAPITQDTIWEAYSYAGVKADAIASIPAGKSCQTGCFNVPTQKICGSNCATGPKPLGTACQATADCCDTSGKTACLDYLCVPSAD